MPSSIEVDANGIQKPQSYKMLRIVKLEGFVVEDAVSTEHDCHACGEHLTSRDQYEDHVRQKHVEQLVDEDAREKLVKRKPGRPPKVAASEPVFAESEM